MAGPTPPRPVQDRTPDRTCSDGGGGRRSARDRGGGGGRAWLASGRACSTSSRCARRWKNSALPRSKSINLNFFCHTPPVPNNAREHAWREALKPYYVELGIDPAAPVPPSNRTPFDAALCAAVEDIKPEVVSFHFGLPEASLLNRVKAAGSVVMSSATTVEEARWLEGEWLRCGDRARLRGRRPSRHVPDRQSGDADRHLRVGAANRGGRKSAGDRRRRHYRRARHRGGHGAWRICRAGRHGLYVLSGSDDPAAAPRRAAKPRATTARS